MNYLHNNLHPRVCFTRAPLKGHLAHAHDGLLPHKQRLSFPCVPRVALCSTATPLTPTLI